MIWIFTKSYFRTDYKSFLNIFLRQFSWQLYFPEHTKKSLQVNFYCKIISLFPWKILDLILFLLPLSSAVTLALKQSMNSYVSLVLLAPLSAFCKLSSSSWKLVLLVFPLFVLAFTFLERRSVCSVWFASSVGVWSWKMNFS